MNYLRLILNTILFVGILNPSTAQENVKIWEEPLNLPTYVVKAPEKNPMFFRNQSYQGASRYLYPYAMEDNITDQKVDKSYRALYIENEYIKLCVLPEIGGRLFYATDKTNGYELFYRQHVIKPANIGMLGAWISGGIEFCVFHHHRASTNIPVDYKLEQHEDGSATIWIGETEPRHRMKWTLGISLFPGKSYVEVDGRLINPTENVNSILYWANVATHVNDDYQVIFPPSTDFAVYHAKNSFTTWPITTSKYLGREYYENNIDASWWKNHPTPVSMFAYDIQEGFLAGYDHGKRAGTMHIANHNIVKGAKLWEWGPSAYGAMWDSKVLTDSDGPYAELMTGAYSDNQPDYSWLKPYEYKTFKQYWYPLRETEGAVTANLQATLNLKKSSENEFLIAANTTQVYENATLLIQHNGKEVFKSTLTISPKNPFSQTISLSDVEEAKLTCILKDKDGQELISYKPVKKASTPPLPDPVVPPKSPEEIQTTEELYIAGLRIKQFHNARLSPEPYFQEALTRDPLDIRSNTMMGIIHKEDFRMEEAARYFRAALTRLAANYTRPRNCEPFYHLGVILQHQGKYDAAYDTLYRAAWDQDFASAAYFHLAQISSSRKSYAVALREINRSLEYNSSNLSAMNLKTSILRKMGDKDAAKQLMAAVLEKDALNFYVLNEGVLMGEAQAATLKKGLRDHPESYLELAVAYLNSGFIEEARTILMHASTSDVETLKNYPSIHYYLGYLYSLEGKDGKASSHFQIAKALSTDYCFPFRFESIAAYQAAIAHNSSDSRAYYYLGNVLYDKQPEKAIEAWEKAVALEPGLAIAHRNIGWGYNQTKNDLPKAIAAYEKAISHHKSDARYYYELDKLYEQNGTDVQTRYQLLTANHEHIAQRPDALLQEIQAILLYGEPQKAIDYLQSYFFPRQEGVDNLHDTYADACLSQGIKEMDASRYKKALEYFKMAETYPENHQMAPPSTDQKNAQIWYYQALAYENMRKRKTAASLRTKVIDCEVRNPQFTFYQALARQKSGDTKQADALASGLEESGNELLSSASEVDFFSKFGEGQSERMRKAEGNFLIGLAHIIRGNKQQATTHLKTAHELNPNSLWVKLNLEKLKPTHVDR